MTGLAEAKSKFEHMVRGAGGAIFGIEKSPSAGTRQEEKLQIGTPDGFVKIAVLLNQPNIDAVLRERTATIVKHARELRESSQSTLVAFPRREHGPEDFDASWTTTIRVASASLDPDQSARSLHAVTFILRPGGHRRA